MTCPTRSGWVGNLSPWACERSEHIDKGAMVWGDGGADIDAVAHFADLGRTQPN